MFFDDEYVNFYFQTHDLPVVYNGTRFISKIKKQNIFDF